jgi:hypothetical protein
MNAKKQQGESNAAKNMYASCDIIDVHCYEDWSCYSNIWGSIAQSDIIYSLLELLCVLSWHYSRRKGSDFSHQKGKMRVDKKMVVFKCLVMTLALGSRSRQGHRKVWAKSATQESHSPPRSVKECEE